MIDFVKIFKNKFNPNLTFQKLKKTVKNAGLKDILKYKGGLTGYSL